MSLVKPLEVSHGANTQLLLTAVWSCDVSAGLGFCKSNEPVSSAADIDIGIRGPPLPPRRWSLGRYGLAVNIVSLCFILPLLFFAFWPVATPVTA